MAPPSKRPGPASAPPSTGGAAGARGDAGKEGYLAVHHTEEIRRWVGPIGLRRRLGRWHPLVWFVLLALVVAAYILAAYYLQGDKLKNGSYASVPVWEKLVDSLRIFPSGFPGYDDGQVWEYNFARYLAAFVFLLASFRLLAIAFGDRLTEARAGIRHGHVVVCGLGDTGRRSVRTFRAEGDNVTCIESDTGGDGGAEARADGALVLSGDATQVTSLDSARADSARAVVCACADDATNTRVATLVAATVAAANKRDGPDVYVRVEDPGLAQLLRGRLPAAGATVFHFFSAAAVWARAMLDDARGPFAAAEPDPPGVIVLGNTELGVAVAVGAARRWHEHVRDRSLAGRARITVCGAGAPATCAGLVERYPAVPRNSLTSSASSTRLTRPFRPSWTRASRTPARASCTSASTIPATGWPRRSTPRTAWIGRQDLRFRRRGRSGGHSGGARRADSRHRPDSRGVGRPDRRSDALPVRARSP